MKEKQLQLQVEAIAERYGWLAYHTPDVKPVKGVGNVRRAKGFPDLCMVKGSRVLFVELKIDGNYPTPEQREWLARLHAAGQEVAVWWPKDLQTTVVRVLGPRQEPLVLPVRYRPETHG